MNRPIPIRAKRRTAPTCSNCGVPMRLFGIEAHCSIQRADLHTYVCSCCDGVQTETVSLSETAVVPYERSAMNDLAVNGVFDPETTHLLGSALDAAWNSARASGALPSDDRSKAATRESLAKYLIGMVGRGERDLDRLVEKAMRRLTEDTISSA